MELFGSLLFCFAFVSWIYPVSLGRWIGRVRNGIGETAKPIVVNMTISDQRDQGATHD